MNLYVVGRGLEPGRKTVRKVLHDAARRVVVVDCRGLASALLSAQDIEALESRESAWIDLGDIRNPPRMLEFSTDRRGLDAVERVVLGWTSVLGVPLMAGDGPLLRRFCTTIFRTADGVSEGVEPRWFTMADLRASLANDEISRWAWPRGENRGASRRARTRVLRVMNNAMSYAHVAALTRSRSPLRGADVRDKDILWLDLPARYLEVIEWKLAMTCVLSRLEDFVPNRQADAGIIPESLPVLLYPPADVLQPFLDVMHPFGAPAVIVLPLHPSGSPPSVLPELTSRSTAFAVEFMIPEEHHARRSWAELVNALPVNKPSGSDAIAYSVAAGKPRRVPTQILTHDLADEPLGVQLDDLRRRDSRARPKLQVRSAAFFVNAEQMDTGIGDPYVRLCRMSTLRIAWSSLRISNSTATGMDRVTSRTFSFRLETELAALAQALANNSYQPLPVKWTTIPKRAGGYRKIGITSLKDRVVQRAFLDIVEPYFEPHFSDNSYGFRAHRGAHHAVSAVLGAWGRGRKVAVRLDVKSCFDTLPHELIMSRFAERVPSSRLLGLLGRWLRVGTGHFAITGLPGVGVVQGYVLAPFLSNIVLTELDEAIEEAGIDFARYADDLTLMVDSEEEAQETISNVEDVLHNRMRMRLNKGKTRIARLEEGFEFLGFRIGGPGVLSMAPDRLRSTCQELERQHVPANPDEPKRTDQWLRRLQLQLDGFSNYFCRLGMTAAIQEQFTELLGVAKGMRDGLPDSLQSLAGWESLPTLAYLVERHGSFDEAGIRRANNPRIQTHSYSVLEGTETSQWILSMALERAELSRPAKTGTDTAEPSSTDDSEIGVESAGRTVVLFEERASLRPDADGIALVRRGKEIFRISYSEVDILVVESHSVSMSSHAAWELARQHIPVVLASPNGDEIAVLAAPGGNRGFIRAAQARMIETDVVRRAGILMLAAKVSNQASLLRYLARAPGRKKGPAGQRLKNAADEIRLLARTLSEEGEARLAMPQDKLSPVLMGYEGKAAAIYWQTLSSIVPDELAFPGRRTRSAEDPLNMALNYVYGILYADVWKAVVYAGLDPGIGIMHLSPRSNGGLVFDLVEELRAPLADRVVLGLLGRGWEPIAVSNGHRTLRKSDRRILARAYLSKRRSTLRHGREPVKIGDLPKKQAQSLRALVLGEMERYPAFRYRW